MEKIDKAIKEQRKQELLRFVKGSKFAIVFVVLIMIALAGSLYRRTDKVSEEDKLSGVLVGIHQVQGNLGSTGTKLSIKLNDRETVLVTAPAKLVVRIGSEVEIIRVKTVQGAVYHHFGGYRDADRPR